MKKLKHPEKHIIASDRKSKLEIKKNEAPGKKMTKLQIKNQSFR